MNQSDSVTSATAPSRSLAIVPWGLLMLGCVLMALLPPIGVGYLASGPFAFPIETGDVLLQLRTTSHELLLVLPLIAALGITLAWRLCAGLVEAREEPGKVTERAQVGAILGVAGAIWLVLLWTGLQRHWHFQSNAYDMGIFTQVFNNLAYRGELSSSIRGLDNMLADHALITWWAFAPLMRIWPGAETLIILQWVCLAAASWPLWLLARSRLSATGASLVLLGWAAYPPLHWFGLFDVHEHALTPVLALSLIWCWEHRNWKWAWAFALLWLGVKEEVGILLFALSLYWIVTDAVGRKHAIGIGAMAIGWFVVYTMVIQPSYRTDDTYYYVHRYAYLGDSMSEILTSLITKPGLWMPRFLALRPWFFVGLLLFPLALLPIRGWKWLLVLLPTFFYSVLAEEPLQTSIYAQYTAPYFPFLFMALMDGLAAPGWSWASTSRGALMAACLGLASNLVLSPLPWGRPDMRIGWEREPMQDRERILRESDPRIGGRGLGPAQIVSSHLAPHAAKELFLYLPDKQLIGQAHASPNSSVVTMDAARVKSVKEREALWALGEDWRKTATTGTLRKYYPIPIPAWANESARSADPEFASLGADLRLIDRRDWAPAPGHYLAGLPLYILPGPHYMIAVFDGPVSRKTLVQARPILEIKLGADSALPGWFVCQELRDPQVQLQAVAILIPSDWQLSPEEWLLDNLPAMKTDLEIHQRPINVVGEGRDD